MDFRRTPRLYERFAQKKKEGEPPPKRILKAPAGIDKKVMENFCASTSAGVAPWSLGCSKMQRQEFYSTFRALPF